MMQLNLNTASTSEILDVLKRHGLKIKAKPSTGNNLSVNTLLQIPSATLRHSEIHSLVRELEELKTLLGGK
jgi:hypothetical protein